MRGRTVTVRVHTQQRVAEDISIIRVTRLRGRYTPGIRDTTERTRGSIASFHPFFLTVSKHLKTSDFDVIERTQQGETEAFGPLVVKYHDRLYRHIHRRVTDVELAKDLTQETWLKAFRAIHTFRAESAFSSWLYRIAENVCIDSFRKQKHASEPLHLIDEGRITVTCPCPSREIERDELRKQLRTAIEHLTTLRREVFLLYYHHELPIKAIAHRLNRSEGTIKTHLRNARLQLQELLTPYLKLQDVSQR